MGCKFTQTEGITKKLSFVALSIIFILIGYPLIILVFLPLLLYRHVVEKLAKWLDPKFGDMLKGMSSVMSANSPYSKPRSVLLPLYYLDAPLDRKQLLHVFNERIIQLRDPKGNKIYSQLRQKIVTKFGYNFWYTIDSFNLCDYIKYIDDCERVMNNAELMQLTTQLSNRSFASVRSPWEIILVPRVEHEEDPAIKSVLILRFHHAICDGFSLLKLTERLGLKPWVETKRKSKPNKPSSLLESKILPLFRVLIEGPYQILNAFHCSNDNHPWHLNLIKGKTGKVSMQQSDHISLVNLKNIKSVDKDGATLYPTIGSILLSVFLQATARTMKRQGLVIDGNKNSVKIHVALSWPLPNHPSISGSTGLANHFSVSKFVADVDLNDVHNTLRNVSKGYKRLRYSILPQALSVLVNILGVLPTQLMQKMDGRLSATLLLSNFSGPAGPIDIAGVGVRDMFVGGSNDAAALSTLSLSYNGRIRYLISGDWVNIKQEDADYVTKSCNEIMKELQNF